MQSRYRGCLLGGAVGDALGAPVEFMSAAEIGRRFGPEGIRDYVPAYGRLGAITDDTQMTLFTADAMMRAHVRAALRGIGPDFASVTARAYQRWLATQDGRLATARLDDEPPGWLIGHAELFSRRAPGNTCLAALRAGKRAGELADNDSKGCGGVMRVAPVGMYFANWLREGTDLSRAAEMRAEVMRAEVMQDTFRVAVELAALTHGHPTGHLTAGALAVIVAAVLGGESVQQGVEAALGELALHQGHEETVRAIEKACELASTRPNDRRALASLGEGWVAEEALAMSVYCALGAADFESAIVLAVNHSGDSDSTGAITGNILGAAMGVEAIPGRWLGALELREVVEDMADDLRTVRSWLVDDDESGEGGYWWERYPGC
jgi:ADP-ribosylglycohydrolase